MVRKPLTRSEVVNCIERKGGNGIPLVFHKWWGEGLVEKYGGRLFKMAEKYPDDILVLPYMAPGTTDSWTENPSYRWGYKSDYSNAEKHSIGEVRVLLPDWSELEQFLNDFPDPNEPGIFETVKANLEKANGRYKLGHWWFFFHELFWQIRGMENLMIDYFENMDKIKIVGKRVVEFYKVIIDRYSVLNVDGILTSDDLGHQNGPMMSPAIFEELYFPFYKEVISYVHSKNMHFFLHSCGDNTLVMEYLIEAGVDVFHPIQTGCMDLRQTAKRFGDKISFLAGIDVQHLLPEGSVDEVKSGTKELIDILYKPEGGLLLAAGNGILPDTPLDNIEAMLDLPGSF